jgi:hypothetical protein
MYVTRDCTIALFVRCGKPLKLSSDTGDCGSKRFKCGYSGADGEVWRVPGVWSQAVSCVLGVWKNLTCHREDFFALDLLIKIGYNINFVFSLYFSKMVLQ